MSLLVEDSPMDISPLDSNGTSPEEQKITEQSESSNEGLLQQNHLNLNATNANLSDLASKQDNVVELVDSIQKIIRPELIRLSSTPRQTIARTLANSHPLMSPNGTDSDSEAVIECRNFPDVIPHKERLPPPPSINLNLLRSHNVQPSLNKLTLLRSHSPDLLSSESEAEVSQYAAAVEANFQSVVLKTNNVSAKSNEKVYNGRKGVGALGSEDITSLDSISNHSFDEDDGVEHNLASLSPSSSLMDGLDDDDEPICNGPEDDFASDALTPKADTAMGEDNTMLPQYSASEEHRDSRNWQKITLPDGRMREIDMRVIEPYKRVLSHGGYLKAGGHNAIVMFCACHLPDHSRADYSYVMDNLFLYVVKTLEQLVTEDYVLIYLHGGSSRRNLPPFPWLKRCYQLLDRRLRKSLKNMYLVHPTFWLKSIVWMARPFVSSKFWRKLVYIKSLEELGTHVTVERAAIPDKVKQYDDKQKT